MTEWISVGALGEAFAPDANLLPQVESLSGTSVRLHLEDGATWAIDFVSATELRWRAGDSRRDGDVRASYRATEIRPGIVLLTFLRSDAAATAIMALLDRNRAIATVVIGQLPSRTEAAVSLLDRIEQ